MQTELSPRQIAGAANGRLAAGAKSPEGRARSAANASKHGLSCKPSLQPNGKAGVLLLNESPVAFDQLFHSLSACFQPSDAHEFTLLRRMAESEWLRQRALLMESAAISEAMRQQAHPFQENSGAAALDPAGQEALRSWHAFSKLSSANPAFGTLQRYAAAHARAYARAERELRDYRISKAESIHPTPEPIGPTSNLDLTPTQNIPEDRWQPLEIVEATEKILENTPDETKVMLPASAISPASPASSIDQPPNTELNSKVGSSLVSSPDPHRQNHRQNWATTVEEAACSEGQPTPYPSR